MNKKCRIQWMVVGIAAVLSLAIPGFAQRPEQPSIVVTGVATVEAKPDQANLRLGVVRQAAKAQQAQEQVNQVANDILAAIQALGVSPEKIRTSRLTLTPVYTPQRNSDEPPRIAAYSASNIVSVDLDDLRLTGPVIDAGLSAGANEIQNVSFSLKEDQSYREKALRQAVETATRKAEVIAEALGTGLGGVLEVAEGSVSVLPNPTETLYLARASAATPVSPGLMEIHASVTVHYGIGATRGVAENVVP